MRIKNKRLEDYLTVAKTPIHPNSLDSNVFYVPETGENPRLLPGIQAQIAKNIELLCGEQHQRIKRYVLVGDALIPGSQNRTADLKILIILNKQLMDIDLEGVISEKILKVIDSLNNSYAMGTLRKIKYVPTVRDLNLSEHQAVYDVFTNQWIKLPTNLNVNYD